MSFKRIKSGIPGFDELISGGFVKGSIIVLAGNPGSGKTTFASQFIYYGLQHGEPGLYISFAETKEDFFQYMLRFGMDFRKYEDEGLFKYVEFLTLTDRDGVELFIGMLIDTIMQFGIKRLVIDPISSLSPILDKSKMRALFHNALSKGIKPLGITSVIVADLPYGAQTIGYGVEEFIADAVIVLKSRLERNKVFRYLEIKKMRGTKIVSGELPFIISSKGVKVFTPIKPKLTGSYGAKMYTTGFKKLDQYMGGGIPSASSTLILGPSGAGKTLLCLNIFYANLNKGLNVHYISFEEPAEQLIFTLSKISKKVSKIDGLIESINPSDTTWVELRDYISKIIENTNPEIIIMDGLYSIEQEFGTRVFIDLVREIIFDLKFRDKVLISTYMTSEPCGSDEIGHFFDNIIALIMRIEDQGIVRKLYICKTRAMKSSTRPLLVDFQLGDTNE